MLSDVSLLLLVFLVVCHQYLPFPLLTAPCSLLTPRPEQLLRSDQPTHHPTPHATDPTRKVDTRISTVDNLDTLLKANGSAR